MTKIAALLLALVSLLLLAPTIESDVSTLKLFQAIGNAEDSGGGW